MKTTRWSPDTCACVMEYEWDETLPVDARMHAIKNVVNVCSFHSSAASDKSAHFSLVIDENSRKNKIYGQLLNVSNITEILTQDDGSQVVQLKKGITFNWSWSGTGSSRIVTISVTGVNLSTAQKNSLQSWCDSNLGAGKAAIT